MKARLLVPMFVLLASSPAAAEEAVAAKAGLTPKIGVGARIGGYGFRDITGGVLSWNDCRMNGTGLFGTVDVGRFVFGELSADFYHATAGQASHGMDRVSFQPLVALGARMLPDKLVSPYVQAGGGPEFTRIQLEGVSAKKVLPSAFMGVGGELNIKSFHLGMNIRAFSMGLPQNLHGNTALQAVGPDLYENGHGHDGQTSNDIPMKQEVAGQMQFTVRYTF